MRIRGEKNRELYSFFERIVRKAYKNHWLAANPVLARSFFTDFAKRFQDEDDVKPLSCLFVLKRIGVFYFQCLTVGLAFFRKVLIHKKSKQTYQLTGEDMILLDSVYYVDQVLASGRTRLTNLPGLEKELIESKCEYAIAAIEYGGDDDADLLKYFEVMREQGTPALTPYQIFSLGDVFRVSLFVVFYPFVLLKFLFGLDDDEYAVRLLRSVCIDYLGSDALRSYLRYLHGAGLANLKVKRLTVVSWHENRAADKMFYKGLRSGAASVDIVGLQLYIFPDNYIGCYLNKSEMELGFGPDRVVSNGRYFLPPAEVVEATVGPSLRYSHLFSCEQPLLGGDEILLLLSYNKEASLKALELLGKVETGGKTIRIRLHPAVGKDELRAFFPAGASISSEPLMESFEKAMFIIGTETGTMLEAVACGIPVINLDVLGDRSMAYMPSLGAGSIWFNARSATEVQVLLGSIKDVSVETRQKYMRQFKENFFCMPLSGRLLEMLGLAKA